MPELPEVETTRRGIEPHILHKTISDVVVREPKLRWPIPKKLVDKLKKQEIKAVDRRGKYLLISIKTGTLIIHLGMSGSLRILPANTPAGGHDHFDLVIGKQCLRLRDPRKFGAVLWQAGGKPEDIEKHKLLSSLGPEPLSEAFNTDYIFNLSRKRQVSIKNFIMNSHVVVGVGNIYASESLFRAGIRPTSRAGKISWARYDRLVESIKQVLTEAIQQGGTTLQDFSNEEGKPGYFAQELQVYGRQGEACYICDAPIQQLKIGQRSSYYCPRCQKP